MCLNLSATTSDTEHGNKLNTASGKSKEKLGDNPAVDEELKQNQEEDKLLSKEE